MSPAGAPAASRVLVVGSDADVSIALHLHLGRAGHAVYCLPGPGELEGFVRAAAPQVLVLLLPAVPDASWGAALTTAASASRVGVRVVVVAPSREIVEPLAAVAGAERALARVEVLARPLAVMDRGPGGSTSAPIVPPPPPEAYRAHGAPPELLLGPVPQARPRAPAVDLLALIDEELVDEPRSRPTPTRVEVNVSLVSEHNFYVGATRRVDSGGVFIATALPPPAGTLLQVRLGLADGRKLDLQGEVSFVREKSATTGRQPSGCGVRLRGLPGWAVEAIDRFASARQPIVYAPR